MYRKQFTFYRSFWDALRTLPKKEQLAFVQALCAYALDGEELPLCGAAGAAFYLVKPVLDAARHKAENGKEGGSKPKANGKQIESKPEANGKQIESKREIEGEVEKEVEKETEKETEVETETENESYSPAPSDDGDSPPPVVGPLPEAGDVVGVVEGRLGTCLSQRQQDALRDFADSMGEGCILRALDAAQDAGRLSFGYLRGVLENKQAQGVKSAGDWDRIEAAHKAAKAGGGGTTPSGGTTACAGKGTIAGTPRDVQPSPERARANSDWLEEFLAGMERSEEVEV